MTDVYRGKIESVTIGGRTFKAFEEAIGRANACVAESLPGLLFTTDSGSSSVAAAGAMAAELQAARPAFEVKVEFSVGIRGLRMLATGRPRPPRAITKQLNRENRAARRDLVHAAGCVFSSCITRMIGHDAESIALDPSPGRVSVPRSLRPFLGRYVGGGR